MAGKHDGVSNYEFTQASHASALGYNDNDDLITHNEDVVRNDYKEAGKARILLVYPCSYLV